MNHPDAVLAPSPLATPKEAAAFLRTSPNALSQMRYRGEGPTYVRTGRRILYRLSDLQAYVESNTVCAANRTGAA
ncbi:hypothetical protein QE449_001697 [Rhodococcus sp. SORGH_AS303]|nr:hypothetical protein [Rhodococcus sp. SORGH_AS_0303]